MKVSFIIEIAKDGGFACYTKQKFDGFALYGYGETVAETKEDCITSYHEMKEIMGGEGKNIPEIEFEWQYDLASFFNYFSVLNISQVARIAGINESLLRRYKTGKEKASQKTYEKLSSAINSIANELTEAKFTL